MHDAFFWNGNQRHRRLVCMDGEAHSSVHDYVQNIGICTMMSIGWLSTFGACVNDNVLTPPCRVWVRSEEIHSRTNNVDCICYNQSSLGTCCPRNIFPLHFCQRQSYHKYLFAISRAEKLIVFDDVSIWFQLNSEHYGVSGPHCGLYCSINT